MEGERNSAGRRRGSEEGEREVEPRKRERKRREGNERKEEKQETETGRRKAVEIKAKVETGNGSREERDLDNECVQRGDTPGGPACHRPPKTGRLAL